MNCMYTVVQWYTKKYIELFLLFLLLVLDQIFATIQIKCFYHTNWYLLLTSKMT